MKPASNRRHRPRPRAARSPRSQTRAFTLVVVAGGLLSGACAVGLAAYRQTPPGTIPAGVRVVGSDWGGKSSGDMRAFMAAWARQQRARQLRFTVNGHPAHNWAPALYRLGVDVDVEATVAEAERVGSTDSAFARLISWFAQHRTVEVAPVWKVDAPILRRYLRRRVAPVIARPVRNARFLLQGYGFRAAPEREGSELDLDAAVQLVSERATSLSEDPLVLPVRITHPTVTAADFHDVTDEIASFRTRYGERGNRRRNIEVACERINGTLIKPGGVFSYNEIVGPRDEDSGFMMAPVIIKGKLQPGMGGGVCQVSTTLYNAALLANLRVVSRTHHAFPVHYAPPGRDATVAYGSIDFRFANSTASPIVVAADGSGGSVRIRLFGKRTDGESVDLERTDISSWDAATETVQDRALPAGTRTTVVPSHRGHKVKLWRVVRQNGAVVRRELISSDLYRAIPGVVAVGAGPAPVKPGAPVAPGLAPAPGAAPAGDQRAPDRPG